jgi:hypothetical protein
VDFGQDAEAVRVEHAGRLPLTSGSPLPLIQVRQQAGQQRIPAGRIEAGSSGASGEGASGAEVA